MKMYLITTGKCWPGYNSSMTQEGTNRIVQIRTDLLPKIPKPRLVCVGTGKRFVHTYRAIACSLERVRVVRSPICGSESGQTLNGAVAVEDGVVPVGDYMSLIGTPGFDAWRFISGLPENTLFCSGKELMRALTNLEELCQEGQLYELNTDTKTAVLVL